MAKRRTIQHSSLSIVPMLWLSVIGLMGLTLLKIPSTLAQGVLSPPSQEPSVPPLPPPLPSLEEIQPPTPTPLETTPVNPPLEGTVMVKRFNFVGSTVFSDQTLAELTQSFLDRPISYGELTAAATTITQYYIDNGYYTSGAYIPEQSVEDGVVTVEILEGSLEEIEITVQGRLNESYIRDRIQIAAHTPLNVPHLLQALQLLQLDPIIDNIQSELASGLTPGTNVLKVNVVTADTFDFRITLDNGRVPSVGSFRRGGTVTERNVTGNGDRFNIAYRNTDGSNDVELSYTYPFNAYNGTLTAGYRSLPSWIIQDPLDELGITSNYDKYWVTLRQPIVQNPTQELAVGLTFDHQKNQTDLGLFGRGFPITDGSDENGRTFITNVRFFQEWTERDPQQVISARSELSFGVDALGTTDPFDADVNPDVAETTYFLWRGQAQWVRLLGPETLFLVQTNIQVADRPIIPMEQFALGGLGSVKGYRQNLRLTDNGFFTNVELRYPVLEIPDESMVVQLVPFFNIGTAWNNGRPEISPDTLASVGLGVLWRISDNFNARIDFAWQLTDVETQEQNWQENGILFTVDLGI
ncbi:ShlB/FhaC/HecB family hemolysin secretion/activation protein [Crocosphaera sp.]|uniref:ShlB/FhaC/HecB family hemolysin secretion/activation protein n=1 Tax=Crocosphaera sp. TaxID=2729996 RepID=UPI003F1E6B65|nr:ShlB/FhaC/HecB family hemolysin secretion/activation protein [Crocosphaera sp.]